MSDQDQTNTLLDFQPELPNSQFSPLTQPMTVKDWLITHLITMIPLVGFIMIFVWAFSSTENVNKTNWAKANLIFVGIIMAIYLVIIFLVLAIVGIGAATHPGSN
jgi:uncharacterized membrane protein